MFPNHSTFFPPPTQTTIIQSLNIVPRFDLKQAKRLLQRGRRPSDVIAAAVRLGDHQLKRSIELYIVCGDGGPLNLTRGREIGLVLRRARCVVDSEGSS